MAVKKSPDLIGQLGKQEVVRFDPTTIKVVSGRNRRITMGNLDELVASIQENGILEPGRVELCEDGSVQLVNGHRRHAACMILVEKGLTPEFPATVKKYGSEAEVLIDMLIANDSKPFDPIEEGMMFQALRDEGMKNEDIAKQTGFSISHVVNRLGLTRTAPEIQEAVKTGNLSVSAADTIAKKTKGDHKKQKELMKDVEEKGEYEVVTKGLKRGRLSKPQWEVAEDIYDRYYGAYMSLKIRGDAPRNLEEKIKDEDFWMKTLDDSREDPILELRLQVAQIKALADMSGLTVAEMLNVLQERSTGKKTPVKKSEKKVKESADNTTEVA